MKQTEIDYRCQVLKSRVQHADRYGPPCPNSQDRAGNHSPEYHHEYDTCTDCGLKWERDTSLYYHDPLVFCPVDSDKIHSEEWRTGDPLGCTQCGEKITRGSYDE